MLKKKISIVIVTYNSQKDIDGCFNSVKEFLDIPQEEIELIIVDNSLDHNADEIKKLVTSHSLNDFINVKYVHNSANLGYGQGNNVGIAASSGDIICIMNPDVHFTDRILKDVLKQFEFSNLGLLAYKQIGGFNYSFYMKPEYRNRFFGFITKFMNKTDLFLPKYFYLSGAFFFVDREKFLEVGNFDENIFMYFEEPDVANRLQKAGYTIKYDNSKTYHHLVGNRIEWSETTFRRENESLLYYLKKYNINSRKYLKVMLAEVQIKIQIARILKDKARTRSFGNELILRRQMLKDLK